METKTRSRAFRDALFLLGIAVALGVGLALATPAAGAELRQSEGSITGIVVVGGQPGEGITAELHQRSNDGADSLLASAATDATGRYTFQGQPSAPSDAFYYIRLSGGKGTLTVWHTFPIIYVHGSEFNVPEVDMADVQMISPAQGWALSLPASLKWNARRSGETYRVFVYEQGKTGKVVLDSGNLGTSTQFDLAEGSLPDGAYEAVVQVRDAVVGYGQSQNRFTFKVGAGASPASSEQEAKPEQGEPAAPAGASQEGSQAGIGASGPSENTQVPVAVSLSANATSVEQGQNMVYIIKVTNTSDSAIEGVVVTDRLPAGVSVDASRIRSTLGSVAVEGNVVTAQVGSLAPNTEAVIEIPVSVSQEAGSSLSNQASAQYAGASDPVQSNAYIAEVAAPMTGQAPAPQQEQQASQPQQPPAGQQAAPPAERPQSPPANQGASQPQTGSSAPQAQPHTKSQAARQPEALIPQTGGAFPVLLAVVMVMSTLLARYLRVNRRRRL